MPAPALIAGLVGIVKTGLGGWLKSRQVKQNTELQIKKIKAIAEVERAKSLAQVEAEYDTAAQHNMRYTWKDEYLVLTVSAPVLLTFFTPYLSLLLDRDLTPQLAEAWSLLAGVPEWYQVIYIGIIIATFGLRWLFKEKQLKTVTGVLNK